MNRKNLILHLSLHLNMAYTEVIDWLSNHLLTCPMKASTGIDCPGCGMQRAIIKLLEGDLQGSLQMNPSALPILFMLIFLMLHLKFQFKHGARIITILFIISSTIIVVNYIVKLANGSAFTVYP
jgi:Protein of unknown function (DUF2752)